MLYLFFQTSRFIPILECMMVRMYVVLVFLRLPHLMSFFLGHGGRQIVDFLEETLEKNIAIELKETDDASVLDRLSRSASAY